MNDLYAIFQTEVAGVVGALGAVRRELARIGSGPGSAFSKGGEAGAGTAKEAMEAALAGMMGKSMEAALESMGGKSMEAALESMGGKSMEAALTGAMEAALAGRMEGPAEGEAEALTEALFRGVRTRAEDPQREGLLEGLLARLSLDASFPGASASQGAADREAPNARAFGQAVAEALLERGGGRIDVYLDREKVGEGVADAVSLRIAEASWDGRTEYL